MNVINELLETEIKYVSDLQIIVNKIQLPLMEILPPQHVLDLEFIFKEVESIYYFNKEFLRDL